MTSFRKDVIDFALDQQTRRAIDEQTAQLAAEPSNPKLYYQLALLYRMQWRPDEALALLLEAVHLDPGFAVAHVALAEIYAVRNDLAAARHHAELAATHGDPQAREMLGRYGL